MADYQSRLEAGIKKLRLRPRRARLLRRAGMLLLIATIVMARGDAWLESKYRRRLTCISNDDTAWPMASDHELTVAFALNRLRFDRSLV